LRTCRLGELIEPGEFFEPGELIEPGELQKKIFKNLQKYIGCGNISSKFFKCIKKIKNQNKRKGKEKLHIYCLHYI